MGDNTQDVPPSPTLDAAGEPINAPPDHGALLRDARKALHCLHIAVEPDVATDVQRAVEAAFTALLDEIATLRAERGGGVGWRSR